MEITSELLNLLLKSAGESDPAIYIADMLGCIKKIETQIRQLDIDLGSAKVRYEEQCRNINEKKKVIQSKCKHWATTYHGDPSGGNDSYTTCDVCGVEVDRYEPHGYDG